LLKTVGFDPVVYDNLSTGHREFVRWGDLVEGDIRDGARLLEALRHYRPHAVLHFAALAYVGESVEQPAKYYDTNVCGSQKLLDACVKAGVRTIVFSSTCATYGVPARLPIAENDPQRPISPYGRTKLIVEQMIKDYAHAYGLRYMSLRYFNAAGADPEGVLSERHFPETHLIPLALQSAAGTLPYLKVFGDDHPTRDGTCVRDYIHVADLATAHVSALEDLLAGGDSAEINLGAGAPSSIMDVIRSIQRVTDRSVPIVVDGHRVGDPPELFADTIVATAAPSFGLAVRH
jgi:UDP-arabinose 4-epimerase